MISGALVMVALDARPALIRHEATLRDGKPVPMPSWTRSIQAVMVVGNDGLAATAYFAEHPNYQIAEPAPLTLVDATYEPLTADTVVQTFARMEGLHREIPRAFGHMLWVPEQYLQHVHLEGFVADVWDKRYLQDLPGLALGAAGHVHRGWFKVAERATLRGLPLGGALTFRAGERIDDDPLKLAILIGIRLGLTPESSVVAPVIQNAAVVAV